MIAAGGERMRSKEESSYDLFTGQTSLLTLDTEVAGNLSCFENTRIYCDCTTFFGQGMMAASVAAASHSADEKPITVFSILHE